MSMKKKKKNNYQGRYFIIICVYLFMLFAKANAQNPEIAITADNFYLGSLNQFSAGFMLRVPVAERFTLNYKLASGYKPDGFNLCSCQYRLAGIWSTGFVRA